ncbi:MAG: hypothetical protein U0105_15515 [Candidatus Obscuribacterales bacterium]
MIIHSALLLSFTDSAESIPESPLEFDFDLHYAESLDACFMIAAAEDIDLIIIDVDSCRDKLSYIRQLLQMNDLTARIPILLLSSRPEEYSEAPALHAVDGVVSATLPSREIATRIRELCALIERNQHSQAEQ